ncbi:unnamed protein product [Acanthoscelides obtectus]|uniref:PiggyBac transposable element-derived protein domain-containing protein n=1 Tax=Acanthoscelides obtectus TaxID=200917 RepID=A0A9P0PM03_ACAOB|nr:unnamed protein product [Acanthoscelides obtectus]CAK1633050.1 PiggyBac transposable element-derived protein 3 [Acanthoscelides obtectus]
MVNQGKLLGNTRRNCPYQVPKLFSDMEDADYYIQAAKRLQKKNNGHKLQIIVTPRHPRAMFAASNKHDNSWFLSNLHLNDNLLMPTKGAQDYDKLYKLRPFPNCLSKNCMTPTKEVCIDESMIKFKGRHSLKQYLPKKPIKRGYKVWILANKSGYCQKFQIYTGKSNDEEKCLGARVVKNLLEGMEAKHHIVYFDNFFKSVPLLEYLKSKDIHACGTVNVKRKFLPIFNPDTSFKRGESQIFISNTDVVAIKWRDKRSVHLLSNFHNPTTVAEVDRRERLEPFVRFLVQLL